MEYTEKDKEMKITNQKTEKGEFGFIGEIKKKFENTLPPGYFGIGDDCAVFPKNETESYLISTDMMIENVHFLLKEISPEDLALKSLAVNVSDIAGMGGKPEAYLTSLSLPKDIDSDFLSRFSDSLFRASRRFNITNIGGDTAGSGGHIGISITIIGTCETRKIKYRSGAKPGDVICVTGPLGDSAAGLDSIIENRRDKYLISRHHNPEPRPEYGMFLAELDAVTAMMDISDGPASDLRRIGEAAGVGALIRASKIPISDKLLDYCDKHNIGTLKFAAYGGEDYELLVTVDSRHLEDTLEAFKKKFGTPLFPIGIIGKKKKIIFIDDNGNELPPEQGYKHF